MRSCPLIEYVLVSDCVGLTTIPLTIFQAEFLSELHLLIASATQLLLIKRVKTLSLDNVNITKEALEKIVSGCPLIERLLLTNCVCVGLTNIQLINNNNNNNNLKHFTASFYRVNTQSFEIDAPTIETIRIVKCPNWYGHDTYFFPRLKTLYLNRVKLSAELFESLSSSNFPSLEDLELEYCYGFSEIQLTVSSIKRLVITIDSFERMVITIYAPNIHYFRLSAHYPQRLIFNTETAREWKSHVVMLFLRWSDYKVSMLLWLRHLSELLKSLRESHISLDLFPCPIKNLKVDQVPNDAVFCKPVPLEDLRVKGYHFSSSFPDDLNCLFLICRPRYIFMNWHTLNPDTDLKKEKDKLSELATFKTNGNEGELSCGYLWLRDLEEISMQVWDDNSQGWHTVGVEGTCFPRFPHAILSRDQVFSEMARLAS